MTFCIVQYPHETPHAKTRFCVGKAQHFTARFHFRGLKVNFGHFKEVLLVTSGAELKPKVMYHLIKETLCFYNVQ